LSPLNKEQLHQIRDERKEQIMRAALKVFAQWGIVGTKISMIAAEAGVSQGLFYHYFKSKDEVFIALVKEALEISYTATKSLHDLPISPLEKIRYLTEAMLKEEGKYYYLLIYQARTSENVPDEAKGLCLPYSMKAYVELLMPIFVEGQQAGEIVTGDLEEMISSYLTILSGVMVLNARENGDYRIPTVDMVMRLVTK
jgi:AcrR family transcriptional regulator